MIVLGLGSGCATDNAEETPTPRGGHHAYVAGRNRPQIPAQAEWAPMKGTRGVGRGRREGSGELGPWGRNLLGGPGVRAGLSLSFVLSLRRSGEKKERLPTMAAW